MRDPVTIFGATGAQGSAVVAAALARGLRVRAVARDAGAVARRWGAAVEAAAADLDDADAVARVLDGAAAAFAHPPLPDRPDATAARVAALTAGARRAGLPLLVFSTSGPTGARYPATPLIAGNNAAAQAVLAGAASAIVLTPTVYADNLRVPLFAPRLTAEGVLDYPPMRPSQRLSWTTHADHGLIAAAALGRPDLAGRAHEIASLGPLAGPALAAALGPWLGRPARFAPDIPAAFGARVEAALGMPGLGAALAGLYAAIGALPDDGAIVDAEAAAARFGVALRPLAEQIAAWPRD